MIIILFFFLHASYNKMNGIILKVYKVLLLNLAQIKYLIK